MDKYQLSERDICTKFITPAILHAGWTQQHIREEVSLTDGRIAVRGNLASRVQNPDAKGGPKRADYLLYSGSHTPIAVVEAKQARYGSAQVICWNGCASLQRHAPHDGEGIHYLVEGNRS